MSAIVIRAWHSIVEIRRSNTFSYKLNCSKIYLQLMQLEYGIRIRQYNPLSQAYPYTQRRKI